MNLKKQQGAEFFSACLTSEAYQSLHSSAEGLSSDELEERYLEYGYNVVKEEKKLSILLELLSHFKNPLVLVLLAASGISVFFGEMMNAIIISIMVLASVLLDFFEEHGANNAAKKLKEKVSVTATVLRDGKEREISIKNLVPGDIIILNSGDLIPAECRIVEANDFFVNQSSLTGESFPREKVSEVVLNNTDKKTENLNEMETVVFMGSNVVSGTAKALVFQTGGKTEFGKIAESLNKKEVKNEFEMGISSFGYFIMKVILTLVLFIFFFNALVGRSIIEAFLFSLAIAVGVTPELLPMIMSITMARGSVKMAKKGVIVKKLSAISNFGSMDILCTDKTGTLTEDKIKLVTYTDTLGNTNDEVLLHTFLNSSYQTGVENPLDKAVVEFKKVDVGDYKKIDEIPFDFMRKIMSLIVEDKNGQRFLIAKGAPENIFSACTHVKKGNEEKIFDAEAREEALTYYKTTSENGYRVLAVAVKKMPQESSVDNNTYSKNDENSLGLLGFVSFLDPAKKGVDVILQKLGEMGVEVKIVTGDNELVAKKICDDVGLRVRGILLGSDLDNLTDDALAKRALSTTIFARFSPDEKNRVIMALRSVGHIVGYMGDGINDAPSIKAADVGISVNNAVDIAKESADFVLTKKSLQALVDGIIIGRQSFNNIIKYIMMSLSSNFGNMFSVVGAIFYLPFLPLLPVQILLNNFIYDCSQITISSDKVDDGAVKLPRHWDMKFIKKFMLVFGTASSLFDFITFFILFSVFHLSEGAFQTGWFLESLATQALVIHVIRTKKVPFLQSRASALLFFSTIASVVIGWIIPYTVFGKFFGFEKLPIQILFVIAILVVIYLFFVEIVKQLFYKYIVPERAV